MCVLPVAHALWMSVRSIGTADERWEYLTKQSMRESPFEELSPMMALDERTRHRVRKNVEYAAAEEAGAVVVVNVPVDVVHEKEEDGQQQQQQQQQQVEEEGSPGRGLLGCCCVWFESV